MIERKQNTLKRKNEEVEPNQRFIIISENGFGGRKYRLIKRYLRTSGKTEKSWETTQNELPAAYAAGLL